MITYKIVSSAGVDMGSYEADSAAEALDAMARDAGYESDSEATAVAGPFEGTVSVYTPNECPENVPST